MAQVGCTILICVVAGTGLLWSSAALAQQGKAGGPPKNVAGDTHTSGTGLRPIEANVGDTGALSTSPRELRVDMRQAAGFERVFQLPWKNAINGVGRPGNFVRFDSGVAAVFPRSEYVWTDYGPATTVPAGTTFYIGKLPDSVLQSGNLTRAQSSLLRVDRGVEMSTRGSPQGTSRPALPVLTRVDRRVTAETEKQRTDAAPAVTLMTDTKARDRWIDQLGSANKK